MLMKHSAQAILLFGICIHLTLCQALAADLKQKDEYYPGPWNGNMSITITVARDGGLFLRDESHTKGKLDLAALSARLKQLGTEHPKRIVMISPEKDADEGIVTQVVNACKTAGLERIAF